jgi:hypothetical protein
MATATPHEDERIVVGDSVRFNPENMTGQYPRAGQDINANSPMTVDAIDKATNVATVSRQLVVVGEFPVAFLVKVDPDTGLPLASEPVKR